MRFVVAVYPVSSHSELSEETSDIDPPLMGGATLESQRMAYAQIAARLAEHLRGVP
jgi:hypothetical protein